MNASRSHERTVVRVKLLLPAICVALVAAGTAGAAAPPQELIGTWTRTVSATDIHRAHSTKIAPGSTWTLVITTGKSSVRSPGIATYTGSVVPASTLLVHMELGSPSSDLYGWERVGKTLILTKRYDENHDRLAVLVGVWKRR